MSGLHLRLLGELELACGNRLLLLPPSKKTRALLAYLASTGRSHRRERLCSLFWDIPDDPRGALRWSLSRLRALVDAPPLQRIVATRETVSFDGNGVEIDLAVLRTMVTAGIDNLTTAQLELAASLFRGEFLEGLNLPDLHEFHTWCLAEREDLRNLNVRILEALLKRLAGEPEAALRYARALTQIDPFNDAARIELLNLLVRLDRDGEAERHFETAVRLFKELGPRADEPLQRAWRVIKRQAKPPETAAPLPEPAPAVPPDQQAPGIAAQTGMVGREAELARLTALLERSRSNSELRVALVTGEPGLGKTRLTTEFLRIAKLSGVRLFLGHVYETEIDDPYRPWREALGSMFPAADGDADNRAVSKDARERFFASLAARMFGEDSATAPLLLAFEDIHWWDEASTDVFDFIMRAARSRPVMVLLTARDGELPDNTPVLRTLRSLRHDHLLEEIALQPLKPAHIQTFVRQLAPGVEPGRVVAASGGNPLFALELARNDTAPDDLPRSIKDLVRDRLDRLPEESADVLRWASVFGPQFSSSQLQHVISLSLDKLISAFETLERHRFLRTSESSASDVYEFVHHLVQQAIYTSLSEPRRRLMHLKTARALESTGSGLKTWAGEIAHHAALAGEPGMAVAGCVAAAAHYLRLFANAEAGSLVRRGMRYAEKLPETDRVQRMIELLQIQMSAHRPSDPSAAMHQLEQLANQALDHGSIEHARRAFQTLSYLRWQHGHWSSAQRDMLRAEFVSRSANDQERVIAMGEAARCLAVLERDLPHAESLMLEATALARQKNVESSAILDARGMLRCHQGHYDEAAEYFEQARDVARREGARESEFMALEHWTTMEVQRRRLRDAEILCADLRHLAERMREGSEAPFARALDAVCRLLNGEDEAHSALDKEIEQLRIADAKHRLTVILLLSAEAAMPRGAIALAGTHAAEALELASVMERPSETAHAHALLLEVACAGERRAGMDECAGHVSRLMSAPLSHFARGRSETALGQYRAMHASRQGVSSRRTNRRHTNA